MTDYFKTIRAYLRGKWGLRSAPDTFRRHHIPSNVEIVGCGAVQFNDELYGRFDLRAAESRVLIREITRLRRNKKKHSHLQKQLDDLLNGGAQISDQQTETTK